MCERIKRECYQNASGKAKSKTTRFSPLHVFLTLALLMSLPTCLYQQFTHHTVIQSRAKYLKYTVMLYN